MHALVGHTVHPGEVHPSVYIPMDKVEVLGHLFQDEQVTGEEQLAVEDRRWWVLRLQRLRCTDKGLPAIVDGFLCQVAEDGWLLHAVRGAIQTIFSSPYLDKVLELGENPDCFLHSWIPRFLFIQRLELKDLAHALLLLDLKTRRRSPCGCEDNIESIFHSSDRCPGCPPRSLSGYVRSSGFGT